MKADRIEKKFVDPIPAMSTPIKIKLQALVRELKASQIIKTDGDLAKRVGLSKSTVSTYIWGGVPPSDTFIDAILREFGYDLDKYQPPMNKVENSKPYTKEEVEFEQDMAKLIATVKILKLKLIDLLSESLKKPSSEVTLQIDKEVAEYAKNSLLKRG